MGNDNSIICKSSGDVGHYYNPVHETPYLLSSENPTIGLNDNSVTLNNSIITCKFKRLKRDETIENYFDLNETYYILAALGTLKQDGGLVKHRFRQVDTLARDFSRLNETLDENTDGEDDRKAVAHGCIMIIAWILFSSIGMLLARYYKDFYKTRRLCRTRIWFAFHRPLMITTFLLTLIAFIIILSDQNWHWIDKDETLEFIHSLFGITAICLAFLQIFVALFRCKKDNCYRFIFNYMHSTFGITIYTLVTVSMFLGLSMDRMNLDSLGYLILIGWMIWLFILFIIMEFIEYYLNEEKKYNNQSTLIESAKSNFFSFDILETRSKSKIPIIKLAMLVIHVLISFGFTITLLYFIILNYTNKY